MIFFFFYDHLPDDMYNEHAQSIMEKTFKIPLTVEVDEDPVVCNALNPKIQIRTNNSGESVILYSKSHEFGSVTTMSGEIKYFSSMVEYNNP